jgi:cyclopropane fatty-acyl-phospholipid synthase-like methyltransferase
VSSPTPPIDEATRRLLLPEHLPRAAAYDLDWQVTNAMGPNPIWLAELLIEAMDLRPGMRVLDLGCGRAGSSIFLARELGVEVWAAELWVPPTENRVRIEAAGLADRVFPISADARALPFAHEWFDAIVSIDAYHYFGTDALYLESCSRFLRRGGQLGMVVPGTRGELGDEMPAHLSTCFSGTDLASFRSPEWWRSHWARTGLLDVLSADLVPDGAALWLRWVEGIRRYAQATGRWPPGPPAIDRFAVNARYIEMLRIDAGRTIGFPRVVARR